MTDSWVGVCNRVAGRCRAVADAGSDGGPDAGPRCFVVPTGFGGIFHNNDMAEAEDLQFNPDGTYTVGYFGCDYGSAGVAGTWRPKDGGLVTGSGVFIVLDGGELVASGTLNGPQHGFGPWFPGAVCSLGMCDAGFVGPCTEPPYFHADGGPPCAIDGGASIDAGAGAMVDGG